MVDLSGTSRLLKALGDESRLRLLHLLSREELCVADLTEVLNLAQSRVSAHLMLLKEVGLVRDRRAGRRTFYSLAPGPASEVAERALEQGSRSEEFDRDRAGLTALLERRRSETRSYFDRVAATFGEEILPGRTWEGYARAMQLLAPAKRYADLGIGDGLLTLMLAEVAERVTAVDLSPRMLDQLSARARAAGLDNIEAVEGDIEALPLPDQSHDFAILSQALHHAEHPLEALREARRILVPGGRVLVIDLLAHSEEWVREKHQHRHLGFTENALAELLGQAGFESSHVRRVARDPHPPHFMTLVATGVRT